MGSLEWPTPSSDSGWQLRWSSLLPRSRPYPGCSAPGTFTNRIQAASWEPRLPVVTDPRTATSLSERRPPLTCRSVTQTSLCPVRTLPSPPQGGSPLSGPDVLHARPRAGLHMCSRASGSSCGRGPVAPGRPRGRNREKTGAAEKAVTRRAFGVNGRLQLPVHGTHPRLLAGLKAQVPSVPVQQVPARAGPQPATGDGFVTSPLTPLNGLNERLHTEKKLYMKKKKKS
ncbi:small ribosomal subunit protein uS2B-like [Vicugna pacos]|uniref:Small ribosomal subunit protein uS2B-like n=1 Tax=Vicugna pacos TaxID=30538 RepID=A0ABM5DGG0_VICPA